MKIHLFLLFVALAAAFGKDCQAQNLGKKIYFKAENITVEAALQDIESQAGIQLAYNPDQVGAARKVSVPKGVYTVEASIRQVVDGQVVLKERGRHVLIHALDGPDAPMEKQEYIIEGYIYDRLSGSAIPHATVYQVDRKYSASTNAEGYYSLRLTDNPDYLNLSFSKRNYFDTIIVIQPAETHIQKNIYLEPRPPAPEAMKTRNASIPVRPKEVEELPLVRAIVPVEQVDRAGNLDFLREVPVQVSFVPSIGTNKLTSGFSENNFSLNLLAGYNSGLKGIEVGGLVNVLRNDVMGLQVGGLGNIVGGKVSGIQIGGWFNNNRGTLHGLQVAGLYNIVLDTIHGAQVGGLFNSLHGSIIGTQIGGLFNIATEDMRGAQIGGLFNHTQKKLTYVQIGGLFNTAGKTEGVQLAGLHNVTRDSCTGYQLAGLWNFAGNAVSGGQISSVFNASAGDISGFQVASVFNIADNVTGTQVSMLNIANNVDGIQVGFLNMADSSTKSFGFISFALKGYHHLEIYADELHPANIAFRTGWERFHNIFKAGYYTYNGYGAWSYGYGFGMDLPSARRSALTLEVTGAQLMPPNAKDHFMNLVADAGLIYRLAAFSGKVDFFAGADLNLLVSTGPLLLHPLGENLGNAPGYPPIFENKSGETNLYWWPGFRMGIRI